MQMYDVRVCVWTHERVRGGAMCVEWSLGLGGQAGEACAGMWVYEGVGKGDSVEKT